MSLGAFALVAVAFAPLASCADLNIYGEPLEACGSAPGSGAGDKCTYRSFDAGAHQVCVTKLPPSFSSRTGQGPWSDAYIGKSWCICIWAYANFFLNHNDHELPLKCSALPAEVLQSEYSLSKFKNCGSMSSRCPHYQKAMQRMCDTCHSQASGDSARAELDRKCSALLTAAGGTYVPKLAEASEKADAKSCSLPGNESKEGCSLSGKEPIVTDKLEL